MEQLVLVKVMVTHPSPHDTERGEIAWHQFYDISPDFEDTNNVIDSYREIPGVEFKVWYNDPDEKPELKATHTGTMAIQ